MIVLFTDGHVQLNRQAAHQLISYEVTRLSAGTKAP
ncbi:hypothetical protein J2X61_006509 [Bacillus sp. 3255]|nr:hypothetical protein [Bacillus sp. 3255]